MKKFALDVLDLMPVAFSHELYMRSVYYSVTVRTVLLKQTPINAKLLENRTAAETHFLVHVLITRDFKSQVKP